MNENDRAFVDSLHHMLQVAIDTAFVALFGVVIAAFLVGCIASIYLTGNVVAQWLRKRTWTAQTQHEAPTDTENVSGDATDSTD